MGPLPLILVGVAVAAGAAVAAIAASGDDEDSKKEKSLEQHKWRKRKHKLHNQRPHFDSSHKRKPDFKGQVQRFPRMEVTNETGDLVFSLAKVSDLGQMKWEDPKSARGKKTQISRLNPLLSAVPNLGIAGEVLRAGTHYVKVNISLESLSQSKNSEALRAILHEGGKIKRHADLFKPEMLTRIVSGGALLTIASVALAQKHLHDISKNLDRISDQVKEVSRFQKEKRCSALEGTLREFMQMKREMADYSFDHIQPGTVMTECVQLSKIERHIGKDVSRAIKELDGADGLGAEFDQGIKNVVMLLKELLLCVMAKLYGCQIMSIVSQDPGWLDSRLDDVQGDIETLKGHYDSTVDAILDKLGKDKHSRDSMELLANLRSSNELESIVSFVDEEMFATRKLVMSRKAPVSVLLKVNGGEIGGFAMVDASAPESAGGRVRTQTPGRGASRRRDTPQRLSV